MSEQQFQILVNGTLTEGVQLEHVKQNVATLFKTSVDKVAPMFSGRKLAVKKGLDKQTALKYKAAINNAGLAATVIAMADETTTNITLAATGSTIDYTPAAAPANIDTSDLVMDAAGATLVEPSTIPEPDIDTHQISIGSVGEDVMQYEAIPDADINTDNLSMAEVGEDIMTYEKVISADIDTRHLKLDSIT